MKTINNICFKNKTVLIRVDFNVPLDVNFKISDDSRIIAALPTIKKIINDGGRAIIMSHLGRPKNGFEECFSLKHLVKHLSFLLETSVFFSNTCIGHEVILNANRLKEGQVLLLENLRFHPNEEVGDVGFAKQLSELADLYVNDAFGVSHRKHASIAIVPRYFKNRKYVGFLLDNELKQLNSAFKTPKKPFTAVLGGAKISSKINVITSLLNKVDNLIIGGGMAYTFVKAKGGDVGNSLVEDDKIILAKKIIDIAKSKGVSLLLPVDSVNADVFNNNAQIERSNISNIKNGYMGLDIGEKSADIFSKTILNSKTIIWNGPMGVFEMKNFENGTRKIGEAICQATEKGAFSLVGGGDSLSVVKKFNFTNHVSYLSTGGGAMLKYLEDGDLAGVVAIID